MMRPKKNATRFIGPVMLLIGLVLAAWVWMPAGSQATPTNLGTKAPSLSDRIATGQEKMAALVTVTTERPLFHGSRRPEAAPEAPVVAPPPEPTLMLVGVISDKGAQLALLRLSDSPQLYRVEQGGQLGRWQIDEIGKNHVLVTKDDKTQSVLKIGG